VLCPTPFRTLHCSSIRVFSP